MLPVAIGASRGVGHAAGKRNAVHALAEDREDAVVAFPARLRDVRPVDGGGRIEPVLEIADLFSPFSTIARLWMLFSYILAAPGMAIPPCSITSLLPWHRVQVAATFRK
jgi:hypothetical protein